jgi:hypothetical protein
MKLNSKILQDDEIDLRKIIKTLWKEKILILSISLIFMIVGYVYGTLQPKIFKTEVVIREAPSYLFQAYQPFLVTDIITAQQEQKKISISGEFNDSLKLNLSSLDTLVQFFENNNKISNFKNYLKKKDISAKDYFKGKFEPVIDRKNNIQNKYSLTYLQPLPGESFLNDYIIFVWQQIMITYKQQIIEGIIDEINIYQQHLIIAEKINLENPILKSMVEGRTVINEPHALFYKGTKVLAQRIIYLNQFLNKTKNLTIDFNPILQQASSSTLIKKHPIIYAGIALLLGLFFSLMIVFIRSIIRR